MLPLTMCIDYKSKFGTPGGSRTRYLQLRKLSLYPDELRAYF